MSPNSDNAMARFLFAILKQKDLRDIDWNLVASDPVLKEPISNGHAARMRYSRFRTTVSNLESRGQPSGRVSKKARLSKSKSLKADSDNRGADGVSIKQEYYQHTPLSNFSPASTTSPYLSDNMDDFSTRMLTPCSDDMARAGVINPAAVEGPHQAFSPSMDFMNTVPGISSPDFSAFDDATFDMANFTNDNPVVPSTVGDWNEHLRPLF